MMAAQLLASVEGKWKQKKHGLLLDLQGEKAHQICSFMWADNFWILSRSKRNLENMTRDLIEEAEKWDLAPEPASLWWTSNEVLIATNGLMYKFLCEEKFKILGCATGRLLMRLAVGGHVGLQEQRCAVEDQGQKIGGPCVFCPTLSGVKKWSCNQKVGN